MMQFYETRMGREFYERTMKSIAASLEKANGDMDKLSDALDRICGKLDDIDRRLESLEARDRDKKINKIS